jgi:hypothetical protein
MHINSCSILRIHTIYRVALFSQRNNVQAETAERASYLALHCVRVHGISIDYVYSPNMMTF